MTLDEIKEKLEQFLSHDFDNEHKRSLGETHRWLFCWDGGDVEGLDCACCLVDCPIGECSCICHSRVHELAVFIQNLMEK